MTRILALMAALAFAASTSAITIVTVPIGDVGNPNDPATGNLYGGVDYAYSMGKYEVTIGQYTAFLNAVAATDTYSLYRTSLATDLHVRGISRSGTSGNYSYSALGSANRPIAYIGWGRAARFANWLHNGQPTGPQGPGTTETGSYTLNGAISNIALLGISRNPGATWFIPSENEWYKAAFYQPPLQGGDFDGYWAYPMQTNSVPYSDQPPGVTPDNTRVGNFRQDDGIANGHDDGFATTASTTFTTTENYLTDVGAYVSSPSYYGTFDQGGNEYEWTEARVASDDRVIRGGDWHSSASSLGAASRFGTQPDDDFVPEFGFRLASILPSSNIADFNHDGSVNAADYVLLRKTDAMASDYDIWRSNFGEPAGSGAIFGERIAVPEPSSVLLAVSIFAPLATYRRRRG